MPSVRSRKNRHGARTPSMWVSAAGRDTRTRPRPARFAAYCAASAERKSSFARETPGPVVATPHEADSRRPDDAWSRPSASCATMRGLGAVVTSEQDAELVAAEPERERALDVGDRGPQAIRDRDERLVAGVVTEAVVHFLHAIDVEHEQRHGPTGDRRPLERRFEPFVERAAVREAGQRVLERKALEPGHVLGVADRGRDVQRGRLQELGVVGAER